MEVHAHGFARVVGAGTMQAERNAGLVEVGVETRRPLEGSDIELSGYSTATSALSGIGLVMARRPNRFLCLIRPLPVAGFDLNQQ
jgi:hypothetical protein